MGSKMASRVYESLILHETDEKFIFEPASKNRELLVLDRINNDVSLQVSEGQIAQHAVQRRVLGIMGVIRLTSGPFLVVITKASKVGEIEGHDLWRVEGTEVLAYRRTLLHLTEEQTRDNRTYLSMLNEVLQSPGYYFSYTYDLTHSLQRLANTSPEFRHIPLYERADQRFVWNGHLIREFAVQPELASFILPVLHGFISIRKCFVNGRHFDFVLISRRSCFRAGVRYYKRGVDSHGHVANFVETEQIIHYQSNKSSFVQTRGSIPIFWSQKPNLKYKPTPLLKKSSHFDGFQRHFDNQVFQYGKQVLINLVDHKGAEDTLEKAFARTTYDSHNNMLKYESFDFHRECSKMRWDRLSLLVNRVAKDQDDFGYFLMTSDGRILRQQEGVFRTNCIDCLDRTNVVQSLLAHRSLEQQLKDFDILVDNQKVENQIILETVFKNTWADNADMCALQYAGTGALKTDFTRTGKRTPVGALKDGYNSAIRYYKNNFYDGFRQDSIDLFLGNYVVEEGEGVTKPCPLRTSRDTRYMAFPLIMLVAFSMCVICAIIPAAEFSYQVMYVLFWGLATLITLAVVYYYGNEYVDRPKLADKED